MSVNPYKKVYVVGDKDLEVNGMISKAQKKLKMLGFYICPACAYAATQDPNCPNCSINGIYNAYMEAAVAQFQMQRGIDTYGHPLIIDGKMGPITIACLFPEDSRVNINIDNASMKERELRSRIVVNAVHQIGVTEVGGDNRGKMVEEYLDTVDLGPGHPWCLALVEYVVALSCQDVGVRLKWVKVKRDLQLEMLQTGHVWTFYNWAKKNGLVIPSVEIGPGDIWVQLFKNATGHAGVANLMKDGYVTTVEGNTNRGGGRQGDSVMSLVRSYTTLNAGIRLRLDAA